ncbi:gliding motility-associated C-terminal domain-containing protein [uncultured Draconibacterium sp.]|uniref:T9SS type B sorting domain-containing protein n=1 Tax=uncultured Draconibacterium sp. TaxID=1573823 RepID=UPI0029C746A6|nr:gliding motility-associated C-terminal domain-containing protein [uncultured Draconibacterium sp.]
MIFTLLAALYGAAQERYDFMEGSQTEYSVDNHNGNTYSWSVIGGLNSVDYDFISTPENNTVVIQWNLVGNYTLRVIETDPHGCSSIRELLISVRANNRSIAFSDRSSSMCFNPNPDESRLLQLLDNEGAELDPSKFPVEVKVDINGSEFEFQINYDNREITVPDSFMLTAPEHDVQIDITLLEATDASGRSLKPLGGSDVHRITVFAQPEIEYTTADDTIINGGEGYYETAIIRGNPDGAVYRWTVEPTYGTSTNLQELTGSAANIQWDGPEGTYKLYTTVTDGNGCVTDTISQVVEVEKTGGQTLTVFAGPDTLIGSCQPYLFNAVYPTENSYTYQWEPTTGLSDPSIPNPVFTPGETTTYILRVTTSPDSTYSDTVTISVSNLLAEAGDDFMIEYESTAVLNGIGSVGEQIQFAWTTANGTFVGGQNTATPEISSAGTYYLQVTDIFGCTASDSVVVSRFISAPIARDDYDTTEYRTAVTIDLLANDESPQQELDPLSLQIMQDPANGFVDINGDGTVTYTPNDGFLGGDVFQYRICNTYERCDNANVFVYVTAADFFIPEAFTPNGDNVNDYFEIEGIELFEQNSITIINRWGKTVYKARGYGISTSPQFWDGKSNQGGDDSDLPGGTYFYVLDLGNGEQPIAGSVYIDR